jgi:hypothetical protein
MHDIPDSSSNSFKLLKVRDLPDSSGHGRELR